MCSEREYDMSDLKTWFVQHQKIQNILIFLLGAFFVALFAKYAFSVFAPFVIAYVIAQLLHPLMRRISTKIKIPNVLNTLLSLSLFLAIVGSVAWLFGHYIVKGATYIIALLSSEQTISNIVTFFDNLGSKFETVSALLHVEISVSDIAKAVTEMATSVVQVLSNFTLNLAVGIPNLITSILIGGIAAFYMLYDYDKISAAIKAQTPKKMQKAISVFNEHVLRSFVRMCMSYVLISVICFVELAIGFFVLDVKDALFIALLIAILDVLPILGSGTVLVPWGIVALIAGNVFLGIGLLVLWGIISIVRQIIEPRIVGSQIGLYPLITIMSLYIGLKTMGGLGLLFGPLYVITFKELNQAGVFDSSLHTKD